MLAASCRSPASWLLGGLLLLVPVLDEDGIILVHASGLGRCPKYNPMKNFNLTQFLGQWYEVERSFYLMELAAGCTTIELQENLKGQTEVVARVINRWTGGETSHEGIAVTTKKNPAMFQYKVHSFLPSSLARMLPGAGYYQVLNTDYNNFAILWTCTSLGLIHADQLWILGRTREISVPLRAKIYGVLAEMNIDSDRLIISKNENCPEY